MELETIGLWQGTQMHLGAGMKVGLVNVREGGEAGPPEVVLAVKADGEHKYILRPGDTFPIGSQTWRFDSIGETVHDRPGAVFSRVE